MSYRVQSIVCKPLRTTVRSRCLSLPPRFSPRVFFPCGSYRNRIGMDGNGVSVASEVLVGDRELLDKKIAAIRSGGPKKMQVIVDFDRTLTRYSINGQPGQSSHGLLQQGNPEYDAKRQQLYEYYHPLEFSPKIPIEEKTKLMEEWWGKTHALLIEGGLTYDAIKQSVANATIAFREGVAELFEYLEERDIPVLIFSAGLADIIEEVLRQKLHRSFKNVKIVSNRMVFDSDGCLVSFKGKTIHSLNKNEHALDMAAPLHEQLGDADGPNNNNASVKKRTNVLLLGDHIGDLGMSDGLNYETRISVGFLNDNVENSLDSYRKSFDIVYLNDTPMWGVVELVSQLC
ncbi:7-methylguanosine phosphate-specific 5'-nucleotidase A [Juglans microcarpa x Juglans regia]|uniref:7-methylguanosine phosphate-specific 5'-nucleotidase A n=1 Tax=Juglans microcarpa x Juglans regia TaxID=2249226 RepID=UPI001B7DBEA3|nr:7-methylguanosine phosphate-specific 5'-nucleotidase A [Juglans microcarpa x Juglans regia]